MCSAVSFKRDDDDDHIFEQDICLCYEQFNYVIFESRPRVNTETK